MAKTIREELHLAHLFLLPRLHLRQPGRDRSVDR